MTLYSQPLPPASPPPLAHPLFLLSSLWAPLQAPPRARNVALEATPNPLVVAVVHVSLDTSVVM